MWLLGSQLGKILSSLLKLFTVKCSLVCYQLPICRHEHVGTIVHYLAPPKNGMDKKGRHLGMKLLPFEDMPDGVSQMDKEVRFKKLPGSPRYNKNNVKVI